jgi:hypothetical protein
MGIRRANAISRIVRVAIVGAFAAAISSYMCLPFLTQTSFLNATPYLQTEKYDSYGAGTILPWLFGGALFDYARLPVLTLLAGAGVVAAVLSRSRVALLGVGLFVMWLMVYFGGLRSGRSRTCSRSMTGCSSIASSAACVWRRSC